MHAAAFAELGLDDWSYEAIEVAPEDFEAKLRGLVASGFAGANVTVPHKLAALELADQASEAAREIGAANTLSFATDGAGISADNTDAAGLIAALPESPRDRAALVIGAGGSARACAWALREAGAAVAVSNRTQERAERLAAELGVEALGQPPGDDALALERFELIVNATTVGMAAANAPRAEAVGGADLKRIRIDADALREGQTVVDLVYGIRETSLVSAARSRGAFAVDGIDVLVGQGAESLRIWTSLDPPLAAMRRAAEQATTQR